MMSTVSVFQYGVINFIFQEILNQDKNVGREIDKLRRYGLWGISNVSFVCRLF